MPFGIPPELVAVGLFLGGLAVVLVSVEMFIETAAETAMLGRDDDEAVILRIRSHYGIAILDSPVTTID